MGWNVVVGLLLVCFGLRNLLVIKRRNRLKVSEAGINTMVVLGSGGHTAEILEVVAQLDPQRYKPRTYVIASTDKMGAAKALACERGVQQPRTQAAGPASTAPKVVVDVIPRSREVGQSYLTSNFTTLYACAFAFRVMIQRSPNLLLVNGPGTCIPICVAAWFLRTLGWQDGKTVYIESIARVATLSLSGKILYHSGMADVFFVQWPILTKQYPRAQYAGRVY